MDDTVCKLVVGPGVKRVLGGVTTAWPERDIMKASPMSDEFHDWLESCPVQWFRGEVTRDHVAYYFETPDEDEE